MKDFNDYLEEAKSNRKESEMIKEGIDPNSLITFLKTLPPPSPDEIGTLLTALGTHIAFSTYVLSPNLIDKIKTKMKNAKQNAYVEKLTKKIKDMDPNAEIKLPSSAIDWEKQKDALEKYWKEAYRKQKENNNQEKTS
jgi:hypothetical protein